jgi:hypothetical protein
MAHDTDSPGTTISDVTPNARRVRFFLQGAAMAGASSLRTVVLWLETPFVTPAAPSDIIVRRGLRDSAARPGSTGFLASDILADSPQNMTNIARSGGNANAHRAVVRGGLVALAYDLTPNMDAANPEKTPVPTTNYNLFVTRSIRDGDAGSWSAPVNLSRVESATLTVVEPRMVPTPGSVVNALTGTPDPGDTQDPNAIFIAYATETNTLVGQAGRIFVSRSLDQGATFEPFLPVSTVAGGQSESQLRPTPDGTSVMAMWMGEQVRGDPLTKDAVFAIGVPFQLPDLKISGTNMSFPAYSHLTLPISVTNRGAGDASSVLITGTVPSGLTPVGITEPSDCVFSGPKSSCLLAKLAVNQNRPVLLTVTGTTEGSFVVNTAVGSSEPDAAVADNALAVTLTVTPALSSLPPVVNPPTMPPVTPPTTPPVTPPMTVPAPVPVADSGGGGGCTLAPAGARVDPMLLLLLAIGFVGLALKRTTPEP